MSTPLMKQYGEIKERYSDCILFFRMGDFYELFGKDAIKASKILGITLTYRNNGAATKTELCGFPYHAAERYIPKMTTAGFKVAICEQIEDPKLAVGIVKRDVIEVITAGTSMSENNLDAKTNNFLCSLFWNEKVDSVSLAIIDITTGYFSVVNGSSEDIENEVYRLAPSEILIPEVENIPKFILLLEEQENILLSHLPSSMFEISRTSAAILEQFKLKTLDSIGLEGRDLCIQAAGAMLQYVLDQKKTSFKHIDRLDVGNLGQWMTLDPATLRNLELLRPLNGDDRHSSLVYVLDHTVTAMGGRKLKYWISHPLIEADKILYRQDAVSELFENTALLDAIKEHLSEVYDIERLIGRVGSGRANSRDLQSLAKSIIKGEKVGELLLKLDSPFFKDLSGGLVDFGDRGRYILKYFLDELPLTIREGKMIAPGASEELDKHNAAIKDARDWISNLESLERERLGISSLKVGFNKVFGYYLEVTRKHGDKVPENYIRKQTLANAERFITPEMKEYEARILSAESQINDLEYRIFSKLREEVNSWCGKLRGVAEDLSSVDAVMSLARAAHKHSFVKPEISDSDVLNIKDGFHPVIKAANPDMEFITNNANMDCENNQIMLITGPNMAGKSTYLRQVGLIVLLAQMGSYVSAKAADIGVVDRIFTRVGASDRLARGQSTFMVEMIETANILHHATPRSLILLDEIGRGTSTFDGLSLAWAIVEQLHNCESMAGKTLFATHYHELNTLASELKRVNNFRITVKNQNSKLLFLRKIVKGACDSSYGIHVAEMAGVTPEVIYRAKRILLRLEENRTNPTDLNFTEKVVKPQQDLFVAPSENEKLLMTELSRADVQSMTPLQALNFLNDLKENFTN